jgi:hypothetical protein
MSSTPSNRNSHFSSHNRYRINWKAFTRMIPFTVAHFFPKSSLPTGRSPASSPEKDRIEVKEAN